MPKKKKGNPGGDPKADAGGWTRVTTRRQSSGAATRGAGGTDAGEHGELDAASMEEVRTQELRYLQDMFAGKLDPVVVHMIMSDCDFKVESALETLFELVDQTSAVESQMLRVSGFKDVYIPKMEAGEIEEDEEDDEEEGDEEYSSTSPFPTRSDHLKQSQVGNVLYSEEYEDQGDPDYRLRMEGNAGSVPFPGRALKPPVTKNVEHDQFKTISDGGSCTNRVDSLDSFSLGREDLVSSQAFRTDFYPAKGPFARDSLRMLNSQLNDLSPRTVENSRESRARSKRESDAETESSTECKIAKTTPHEMNIHLHGALPGVQKTEAYMYNLGITAAGTFGSLASQSGSPGLLTDSGVPSERESDQFASRGSSVSEFGTGQNSLPSDDLETDAGEPEGYPEKAKPMTVEQLFGKGSFSLETRVEQDDDPDPDDLETLLEEIEMCPDKESMSEEKVEPTVTRHQPELEVETVSDHADSEKDINPDGIKSGSDCREIADPNLKGKEPDYQSSQIRMEGTPDNQQQLDWNLAAPTFIPRAYARPPTPTGYQQHPPTQGFQPRHSQRMPRAPHAVGRASSLQRHLKHSDGQGARPFFTPFPASQEQKSTAPKGAGTRGQDSAVGAQHFSHPVRHFPPQEGGFRQPVSKQQSQVPFRPQNQAPQRQRYPSMPNQNYRPFRPRMMSPAQGTPLEGAPPPERLRTNSPHEGAREPHQDPPQWPTVKHTSYAPRTHVDSARHAETEDKVVPLPKGKVLCLMRGCPGSGKSTLARKLVGKGKILSTDDFFVGEDGQYHFDVTKLNEAHDWSHKKAKEAMESGITPLIIDNTNIERWTMKPYVAMALEHGYAVEFREPTTPWKFKLGKLFKNNTHNVPRERIKMMIERFERHVTVENILASSKPTRPKRKPAEAEKCPSSRNSERRLNEKEKGDLEGDGGGHEEMSRRDTVQKGVTTTENKKEEESVTATSSRAVEYPPMAVVSTAMDANMEGSRSDEEIFMSGGDEDLDAMMDQFARKEAGVGADKQEVNEVMLGEARDEGEEDGEVTIASETEASCDAPGTRSSNEKLTESSLVDTKEDADGKIEENVLPKVSSMDAFVNLTEKPVGVEGENSYESQLVETAGEDDKRDFHAKIEPSWDPLPPSQQSDDFKALLRAFVLTPRQQTVQPCSESQELHANPPSAQKEDARQEEDLSDEDDFAAMMNLVADASCDTYNKPVTAYEEVGVSDTQQGNKGAADKEDNDLGKEINSLTGSSCIKPPLVSELVDDGESPKKEETDNKREDIQTEVNSAKIKVAEEDSHAVLRQQTEPKQENQGGLDKDNLLAVPKAAPGAEPTDFEGQGVDDGQARVDETVQKGNVAPEFDSALDSVSTSTTDSVKLPPGCKAHTSISENEHSAPSVNMQSGSLAEGTSPAEGNDSSPNENEISKEERDFATVGESNGPQVDTGGSDSQEPVKDAQVSITSQSRAASSGTIVPSEDTTGSCIDTMRYGKETKQSHITQESSNVTNHVNVSNNEAEAHHSLPSPAAISSSSPVIPADRSLSPSPVVSSWGQGESTAKQPQEGRKLRRSRSHGKSAKIAAVFPTLSPTSGNWSEFAAASVSQTDKVDTPQITSADTNSISFTESGTLTLASDFSHLQKLYSDKLTEEDLQKQGLQVVIGRARQFSATIRSDVAVEKAGEPHTPSSSNDRSPIPVTVRLHKSTMTDHEDRGESTNDGLKNLIALFPSVSYSDLKDILTRCMGDQEWATNILLDDFSNKERNQQTDEGFKHQGTDAGCHTKGAEEKVPLGLAKVEPDVTESQVDEETPANEAVVKELLESKRVSQAGNLATNMISVVDDILKTISSEETKTTFENFSSGKEQAPQKEITGSHQMDTISLSQGQEQTSRDADFARERPDTTKEDSAFRKQQLDNLGPENVSVDGGTGSQRMVKESRHESEVNDVLEGPTQEAAYDMYSPQSTEIKQQDECVDFTNTASAMPGVAEDFHWNDLSVSPPFPDFEKLDQVKEAQVVRPKTSRSASQQSRTKVSKMRESRDVDISKRTRLVLEEKAPLRRDELKAAGGVQFSWNDQGEEEFRVPRPEQTMTGYEDNLEVGDGSVMTEEQADEILQGQPVRRKVKELGSLKEGLMLQLPPAFALQLQEMFGSIGFHLLPDGLPAEDLQVHVDYNLAKQLHSLWAQTLQTRFDQEEELDNLIKADEELARKLQQEEELQHMTTVQSARSAKYQGSKAAPNAAKQPISSQQGYGDGRGMKGAFASPEQPVVEETKGLREIMEEELAAQISKDVEVEEKLATEGSVSIATKLKRDKLYSEFPTIDRGVLEDIFRANNYHLDPTIRQVNSFFISASGQPKDVYTDEALERREKRLIELTERESLASSEGTDDSTSQESLYQSYDNPDYQDYRAEATQHYRLRHEAFQKAAAAYKQGQKQLASFYSQQGHLHTEKLKDANKRASEAILASKNSLFSDNTLDLHGLHVDEALMILNQVLSDKKAEIAAYEQQPHPPVSKPPPRHIFIITGKGNRSRGGVARIRPAVTELLKREGYRFSMPNAGLMKVGL